MSPTYVTRTLHADLETAVSAYIKLRPDYVWSCLLESVEGSRNWAQYSILAFGMRRVFRATGTSLTITHHDGEEKHITAKDPLAAIEEALKTAPLIPLEGAPPCVGGIFGYVTYDAVRSFEPLPDDKPATGLPDACFFEPEVIAVFHNTHHTLTLYARDEALMERSVQRLRGGLPGHRQPKNWVEPQALDSRDHFKAAVDKAKEHIFAGDIIQVVLSRRFELPSFCDPFDVYRGLRTINPSPYLYYVETPDVALAGASPEVMVRVLDGRVIVRPIAGTRPRGSNAHEDEALAQELRDDPKEVAEHIMLVDLGRNDVGRVSQPATVRVKDLMVVENYSHVMHLVSEVEGQLEPKLSPFDALRAAFPAGTLSGAPKVRAMQIIDALEPERRGVYGGAVGYFGPHNNADFGIAIRTLVAFPDRFVIQAGAGIVADSDPSREADETEHKAQAVVRATKWAASEESVW